MPPGAPCCDPGGMRVLQELGVWACETDARLSTTQRWSDTKSRLAVSTANSANLGQEFWTTITAEPLTNYRWRRLPELRNVKPRAMR